MSDSNPKLVDQMVRKITLYTLSTCGHCRQVKRFLDSHQVPYESIDVDLLPKQERRALMREIRKLNPTGSFPTSIIGDKTIVGYREAQLREALGL